MNLFSVCQNTEEAKNTLHSRDIVRSKDSQEAQKVSEVSVIPEVGNVIGTKTENAEVKERSAERLLAESAELKTQTQMLRQIYATNHDPALLSAIERNEARISDLRQTMKPDEVKEFYSERFKSKLSWNKTLKRITFADGASYDESDVIALAIEKPDDKQAEFIHGMRKLFQLKELRNGEDVIDMKRYRHNYKLQLQLQPGRRKSVFREKPQEFFKEQIEELNFFIGDGGGNRDV